MKVVLSLSQAYGGLCTPTRTCTHMHTHSHAHTHIHTPYIHICTNKLKLPVSEAFKNKTAKTDRQLTDINNDGPVQEATIGSHRMLDGLGVAREDTTESQTDH